MKAKMINETHVEGLLYDHKLTKKVSGENSKNPGTTFINGTIDIATDDSLLNVVTVHYSYVTPTYSSGKTNTTFGTLESIIENEKTVVKVGAENALRVRCDPSIGLNEFYSDRNGEEQLVSAKRNEGGFIHVVTDALNENENERATWKCDIIITGVREVEADEEKNLPAKAVVKGYTFDFRNALLPVEFQAKSAAAINYFLGLDASTKNPVFTKIWGRQVSQTVTKTTIEESAFGEAQVNTRKTSVKEFVITGANPNTYVWDDESSITAAEYNEALANRETYLATLKKNQADYAAARAAKTPDATPAAEGKGYKF